MRCQTENAVANGRERCVFFSRTFDRTFYTSLRNRQRCPLSPLPRSVWGHHAPTTGLVIHRDHSLGSRSESPPGRPSVSAHAIVSAFPRQIREIPSSRRMNLCRADVSGETGSYMSRCFSRSLLIVLLWGQRGFGSSSAICLTGTRVFTDSMYPATKHDRINAET